MRPKNPKGLDGSIKAHHWTARSACVYISGITDAPPVMRVVLRRMSEDQEKFLKFVEIICARPGMVIGRADFFALVAFLDGYITGVSEHGRLKKHPFGGLLMLLEEAHGFSHPAWGWPRHYLHDKGSDECAIRDFPGFLRQALEVPDSRIDEIFRSSWQRSHKPPVSPQTSKYDR